MRRVIRKVLRQFNRDGPRDELCLSPDLCADDVATIHRVRGYTLTPFERVVALCDAVRYISAHGIAGAFVECDVRRGGSVMAAALTPLKAGDTTRDLYLFDTFEGMPRPTDRDIAYTGEPGLVRWSRERKADASGEWLHVPMGEVRNAIAGTGYDMSHVRLIKGRVEETIPREAPANIALLRLDTDWYESTRHELVHLFPRLSPGGVIIIDDYGHWQGARQATDEYLATHRVKLLLTRIDYAAWIGVKSP